MDGIRVNKLNKSYYIGDEEYKVLKDLDISFNYGEFVAIYGESGSGKSTFMNVLGGLDTYDSGEILINGENISKFTSNSMDFYRNRKIGFVFQEFKLLENLTLLENVMMPLNIAGVHTKEAKKRANELLELVGLKSHAKKKAKNLSGGQKQRVAIARALANDPDIILADEPTGALDSQTSVEILNLLKEIVNTGKLVIAITHSEDVAKFGNRIVTLVDGKFVEDTGNEVSVERSAVELPTKSQNSKLSFRKAFKIARSNLFSKKFRTTLVALGVSLGITGALVITSISESAIDEVVKQFSAYDVVNEHVAVSVNKTDDSEGMQIYSTTEETANDLDEKIDVLSQTAENYAGFKDIYPEYLISSTEKTIDEATGQETELLNMFANVSYATSDDIKLTYGNYPKKEHELYFSGNAYGIENLATLLGKEDKLDVEVYTEVDFVNKNDEYYKLVDFLENEIIGETFTKNIAGEEIDFKIVGSLEITQSSMSMTDLVLPAAQNKQFIEDNKYSFNVFRYFIGFDNEEDAQVLVDKLGTSGSMESSVPGYTITAQDFRALAIVVEKILDLVTNVFLVLMSISLIVSMFMVNVIVYISTIERKVEIGTLRAIGAKKQNVTAIFISEGIWIGIIAFILSCIGASILILIVNAILHFLMGMPTLTTITLSVKWLFIIAALVSFVMFAASLLPAMKASKQNPIDALREE